MNFILKTTFSLLIINLLSFSVFAQSKDRIALEKAIWGKTAPQFTDTEVPEKWKGESAVILFQDYKNVYDKRGIGQYTTLVVESTFHTRVVLLDKNAVTEYSEFSFNESSNGVVNYRKGREGVSVGFKIIKPTGKTEVVNLEDAVEVQSSGRGSSKKIAIPNLEVGDIIDFFYHETDKIAAGQYYYFTPFITTLSAEYPAKYIRCRFDAEKKFYVSYLPLNGAPDITKREGDKLNIHEIEMRDVEKVSGADMMYLYRSLPTIKYQVFFATGMMSGMVSGVYKDYPNDIRTGFSKEELKKASSRQLMASPVTPGRTMKVVMKDYYKEKGKDYKQIADREIIKEVYKRRHFHNLESRLESYYIGNSADPLPYNDRYFVNLLASDLRSLDFAPEVLLTTRREYGTLDDILLDAEMEYLLRVKTKKGEYIYLSAFELHPNFGRIPDKYEGQTAIAYSKKYVSSGRGYADQNEKRVTIPKSTYEENKSIMDSKITLDADMENVIFDNKYTYSGHSKDYYQYRLVGFYDYWDTERKVYDKASFVENSRKKSVEKNKQLVSEFKKNVQENIENRTEGILSNQYDAEELKITDFKILNDGRMSSDNANFEYKVTGETGNLIQQAGPNYLLNAGLLIGTQREVEEKDKERNVDIYMGFARSFDNNITVKIPAGYTVEGIEKLNINIKNDTGAFISTAKMEGENLVINTQKWYADNYEPVTDWSKMLDFLEAAYEFTEVKVLLKKK